MQANNLEKSNLPISHLASLLEKNELVVTGEITPPHGSDANIIREHTHLVAEYCDAINITDNVRGIPTMSSMVCAHLILQAGAEPIMQMSARDRNRILFESELYGAYALGVRNLMFITGDHTLLGSHPEAKMVYDMDSIQALQIAKHLMHGTDLSGQELEGTPTFLIGATFNPYADPLEMHIWRTEKKQAAGARFFQTQAIYDTSRLEEFMKGIDGLDAGVLAGIIPLKGPKMARFMNKHIPGIKIPDSMISRLDDAGRGLKGADKREAVRAEGLLIASETIEDVRKINGVDGIHIMGVGWESAIPELVKGAGLYPRPR